VMVSSAPNTEVMYDALGFIDGSKIPTAQCSNREIILQICVGIQALQQAEYSKLPLIRRVFCVSDQAGGRR